MKGPLGEIPEDLLKYKIQAGGMWRDTTYDSTGATGFFWTIVWYSNPHSYLLGIGSSISDPSLTEYPRCFGYSVRARDLSKFLYKRV